MEQVTSARYGLMRVPTSNHSPRPPRLRSNRMAASPQDLSLVCCVALAGNLLDVVSSSANPHRLKIGATARRPERRLWLTSYEPRTGGPGASSPSTSAPIPIPRRRQPDRDQHLPHSSRRRDHRAHIRWAPRRQGCGHWRHGNRRADRHPCTVTLRIPAQQPPRVVSAFGPDELDGDACSISSAERNVPRLAWSLTQLVNTDHTCDGTKVLS